MKISYRMTALVAAIVAAVWWHTRPPEPTVLAFRLGQTFEQVVRESSSVPSPPRP